MFKYEIRQLVCLKQGLEDCKFWNSGYPKIFSVRERLYQECMGGVQILYLLTGISPNIPEDDLVSLDDLSIREFKEALLEKSFKSWREAYYGLEKAAEESREERRKKEESKKEE
jgi:hypothetical protein